MSDNYQDNPVDQAYASVFNDVALHRDELDMLATEIIKNQVSNYPVFVAHKQPINLGKLIISQSSQQTNWNISISILEDLVNKGIVKLNKVDDFRKVYKDPTHFFCFLVFSEKLDPQFIFIKKSRNR